MRQILRDLHDEKIAGREQFEEVCSRWAGTRDGLLGAFERVISELSQSAVVRGWVDQSHARVSLQIEPVEYRDAQHRLDYELQLSFDPETGKVRCSTGEHRFYVDEQDCLVDAIDNDAAYRVAISFLKKATAHMAAQPAGRLALDDRRCDRYFGATPAGRRRQSARRRKA